MDISLTFTRLTSDERAKAQALGGFSIIPSSLPLEITIIVLALAVTIGGICLLASVYGHHKYDFPNTSAIAINYSCDAPPPIVGPLPPSGVPLSITDGKDLSYTISNARITNQDVGVVYTAGTWLAFIGSFFAFIFIVSLIVSFSNKATTIAIDLS